MLHNLADHRPITHHALDLLGERTLPPIFLLCLPGYVDVDRRALTREDFRPQALLSQVQRCAINLIEHDRGQFAKHLHLKPRRFDNVHGRHEGIDEEGDRRGGVNGNGICLVKDANRSLRAAGDEDGVRNLSVDFEDFGRGVEVLDNPFVAIEFFARRLLCPHTLWLGPFARRLTLAAQACLRVGSCGRDGRAGAE